MVFNKFLFFLLLQNLVFLIATSLLRENIDGVVVFHVKTGRRVGFIDWGTVESESDLVDV